MGGKGGAPHILREDLKNVDLMLKMNMKSITYQQLMNLNDVMKWEENSLKVD
jgi:hypothetical protein